MSRRSSSRPPGSGPAQSGSTQPGSDKSVSARMSGQRRAPAAQFSWKTYGYAVLMFCALAALATLVVLARPLLAIDTVTHARLLFAGFHSEYTSVDGHRIHYFEGGLGKPILLIPGLGGRAT